MSILSHINRRHIAGALVIALATAVGLAILWYVFDLNVEKLKTLTKSVTDWMETLPPIPFALACIVVFLFPIPASVVFIAAGAAWGVQKGLGVAFIGILGNQLLSYFLAAKWMRKPIVHLLARHGYHLPEVPKGKGVDAVLLVRLAPALPLFAQNYLLGIARVPLVPYLGISLPCTLTHVTGFLIVGSSVYHENVTFAITGVFFLCFVLLCLKLLRDYMTRKRARNAAANGC